MIAGSYGAWLFKTPYTAYPQQGVLAYIPYLLLGKLVASPELHTQAAVVFHVFRWLAVSFELVILYLFSSLYIHHPGWRKFALVLAALGGGLGWGLVAIGKRVWLNSLPLDFISPESFGFLAIFGLPHLALARGLLFMGLWAYLNPKEGFQDSKHYQKGLIAGSISWAALVLVQPMTALTGWFLVGMHLAIRWIWVKLKKSPRYETDWSEWKSHLKRGLLIMAASAPFLTYLGAAYLTDPFLNAWVAQNRIQSPHPWHYFIAYGLFAPLVLLGGISYYRTGSIQTHFLILWAACLPILAYAPTNMQRRLPEGIWVVFVIIAVAALEKIKFRSRIFPAGLLVFSLPTTLILLIGGTVSASLPSSPQFISAEAAEAYEFFDGHAEPQSVVLTSFRTGNELPSYAPVRVMVGHGPESANGPVLLEEIENFFQSDTLDTERVRLLETFGVEHVLWGPYEKELGDWDPHRAVYLESTFSNPSYTIFRVAP
jgi:hypothetical protein